MRGWVLGAVLALAVSAPALAQQQQQQAVSAELIRLHDDLHLSKTQEAAWRDYARAVASRGEAQARHRAAEQLIPNIPAPRRIALMEAALQRDLDDFRRQGAAVIAFYSQLTPEQQRTFDRETLPRQDSAGR